MNAQQEKTVLGDMSNRCPYCKEQIQQGALKCRYCQSSLLKADGPSSAEKMADLVIKTVGIVPAVMTLLLLLAGLYGFKAVSDVEKMAKEVETTSEKIQKVAKDVETTSKEIAGQRQFITRQMIAEAERQIDMLLNDLPIDSKSPRAVRSRQTLRELLAELDRQETGATPKSPKGYLVRALFAHDEKRYDEALEYLQKADHDLNKFRLTGIVLIRKGEIIERTDKTTARKLYEDANKAFATADKIAEEEHRVLLKNRGNLGASFVKIDRLDKAEEILTDLIKQEPDNQFNYYNLAAVHAKANKLRAALDTLQTGSSKRDFRGIIITKKDLSEDIDFNNLRDSTEPQIRQLYADLLTKIPDR